MDSAIRALFPAALSGTYLNSAAIGPLPTPAVSAIADQLKHVSEAGSANLRDRLSMKDRVRGLVAAALGVDGDDIAFTRNTSDGLCAVAAGLAWSSGDNIVSIAGEFPANYYPWRSVHDRHGVELRLAPSKGGRIDTERLCSMIDANTKLVTVSAVQYASGFRLDLERIGRAARRHDALFAVDIIQAFGAMPLDLEAQQVDIACGAGYKWLCSPEGCGIFYISPRARDRVESPPCGWMGVERPWDFGDRAQEPIDRASKWETGMGGTALLCGLEASLEILIKTGIGKIERHLTELTEFLCEIIPGGKYEVVSSRSPGERSQIVSLACRNGHSADSAAEILEKEGVTVSSRDGLVRISPHFFNTFDDIQTAASALP